MKPPTVIMGVYGAGNDAWMMDEVHYNISGRFPKLIRFKDVPTIPWDLHL